MSDFADRTRRCLLTALLLGVCATTTACGTSNDMKKRLAALQDQLTQVQNSNDRLEERVAALELATAKRANRPNAAATGDAGLLARPELKVVKVEPGDSSASGEGKDGSSTSGSSAGADSSPSEAVAPAAVDDGPRPLIRGTGDKLETRMLATPAKGHGKPAEARAKARKVRQTP